MNNSQSIRKAAERWLSLLFAPLTISLAAIIITDYALRIKIPLWLWFGTIFPFVVSVILYFFCFHNFLDRAITQYSKWRRKQRFKKPFVLILDGTINGGQNETPPNPVYSNRPPVDWKTALEDFDWSVNIGPMKSLLDRSMPDLVINPFGEVYPEADFVSNASLSHLKDYVWAGGVFVSIAGMPFFYRYNPSTGFREGTGRLQGFTENNVPVWKPIIVDLFPNIRPFSEPLEVIATQLPIDINRFGNIANAGASSNITSFRACLISPPQLLPLVRDQKNEICVIGAFLYGEGAFIFSGVSITDLTPTFEKVIASIKGWAKFEAQGRTP